MEHKTLKAATTATDRGDFTAIAACYTVDRTNERIVPGAFAGTIERWQKSSKMLPLHWDHSGSADAIIGFVDPNMMREAEEGLYVRGHLDLESGSDIARHAWRAMKNNSVGLSFGYLVTDDETVEDVKHLKEIDLFEISITPTPVNPDTRIMEMKSDKPWLTVNEARAKENLPPVVAGDKAHIVDTTAANVADVRVKLYEKAEDDPGEEQQIEDAGDEEPSEAKSEAQDPLSHGYDLLEFQLTTAGIDMAEPPKVKKEEPPEPLSLKELEWRSYDLMLETLIGSEK